MTAWCSTTGSATVWAGARVRRGAPTAVSAGGLFSRLGCRGFLSEPVTVPLWPQLLPPLPAESFSARAASAGPAAARRGCRCPGDLPAAASGRRRHRHRHRHRLPASGPRRRSQPPGRKVVPGPAGARPGGRPARGAAAPGGAGPEAALAAACEELRAGEEGGLRPHPSFPTRGAAPSSSAPPGQLPPRACVLGSRVVCAGVGVEGAAPRGASVTMGSPRADCDARGSPYASAWRCGGRAPSGAARSGWPGGGRASAGWGGCWASLSVGSLPAALPVIGRPGRVRRGETLPGRGSGSPAEDGRATYIPWSPR